MAWGLHKISVCRVCIGPIAHWLCTEMLVVMRSRIRAAAAAAAAAAGVLVAYSSLSL